VHDGVDAVVRVRYHFYQPSGHVRKASGAHFVLGGVGLVEQHARRPAQYGQQVNVIQGECGAISLVGGGDYCINLLVVQHRNTEHRFLPGGKHVRVFVFYGGLRGGNESVMVLVKNVKNE